MGSKNTNISSSVMATFYSVALILVSTGPLLLGLGNLLKVPPYNAATFMVDGKPGTGETPIEKLLEAVFSGWYISSILGVILAYFYSPKSLKFTLICPMLYHLVSTYGATFLMPEWGVCNEAVGSYKRVVGFHGLMSVMFVYLFAMT